MESKNIRVIRMNIHERYPLGTVRSIFTYSSVAQPATSGLF